MYTDRLDLGEESEWKWDSDSKDTQLQFKEKYLFICQDTHEDTQFDA